LPPPWARNLMENRPFRKGAASVHDGLAGSGVGDLQASQALPYSIVDAGDAACRSHLGTISTQPRHTVFSHVRTIALQVMSPARLQVTTRSGSGAPTRKGKRPEGPARTAYVNSMSDQSVAEPEALDPLRQATRWARGVLWQAHRLREGLLPPGPAEGSRPGFFDRLGIEQHFLLTACAQLLRALDSLGIEPSLPALHG